MLCSAAPEQEGAKRLVARIEQHAHIMKLDVLESMAPSGSHQSMTSEQVGALIVVCAMLTACSCLHVTITARMHVYIDNALI